MKMRTLISLTMLAALFTAPAGAKAAALKSATKPATASANITNGIAIEKTKDLVFGSIVPGATAGTVVVTPTNARTSTGPLTFGNGTSSNASFDVTHPGGTFGTMYGITLPATMLVTSGANSMTVDTFTSTPTLVSIFPILVRVDVGATLHVAALQPVGTYVGTFNITITEQ